MCLLLMLSGLDPFTSPAEAQLRNVPLPALPDNQEVLVLEVEGGELVTLSPGQMFYETPDDIHTVSQNASSTEPAKFLVHIIKTIGVQMSTPAEP